MATQKAINLLEAAQAELLRGGIVEACELLKASAPIVGEVIIWVHKVTLLLQHVP